jgi:hypothetical protein
MATSVAERRCLDDPDDEIPGAHLDVAEHQRAVDPATPTAFSMCADRSEIDVARAAGDRRLGDVLGPAARNQLKPPDDAVQVQVWRGHSDLLEPVHQLHIRLCRAACEDGTSIAL